jgi:hypothetical protein
MRGNPIVFALAAVFIALLVGAAAARAAVMASTPIAGTNDRDTPEAKIDDARRALEQAAAQADFASDAREIGLLQQAHDDLSAAIDQLHGLQHQRTLDLLSDLDQAMRRTAAGLGRLASPGGEGFGPLVPSRQLLGRLATEAVELQRNAPERRMPNTIIVDIGHHRTRVETGARAPDPIGLANQQPLSWPLGYEAAWPQLRVRF